MWTHLLLRNALLALSLLLLAVVSIHMRRHPRRSKQHPGAVRMTLFVPIVGWILLIVGLIMGLAALTLGDPSGPGDTLAMQICSVVIVGFGLFFVWIHHNFWLAIGRDTVRFRSILGIEHEIRYDQIAQYALSSVYGTPQLRITALDGTKLSINTRMYDVSPIVKAIEYRQRYGIWPHLHQ